MNIAVIIPTLNEATALPGLLADLAAQEAVTVEVVIVDGGSVDDTVQVADQASGNLDIRVITSEPGRGRQMNAGAAASSAEQLLFLHADSRLPDTLLLSKAIGYWQDDTERSGPSAGHFSLRFCGAKKRRFLYRYMQGKTTFNRPNCFNGDQGMLIGRKLFAQIGGFDESMHFLEDQRISVAIHRQARWITLPGEITTNARRFEQAGPRRQWLLMFLIMGAYGAPVPGFLARAPMLYREQKELKRLRMAPYFRCYASVMREMGWRGSFRGWWGLGGFAAGHSWQIFYGLDLLLRQNGYPILRFYDRYLAWIAASKPIQAFAAMLMATLVFGIAWPVIECFEAVQKNRAGKRP